MSRATADDQLRFLLSCVKHSNNGKIDFIEVAAECGIVSKGAAAKRYERLMKTNGIRPNSEKPTASPVRKEKSRATIAREAAAKRRKIEGDEFNVRHDEYDMKEDDDDDIKPFILKEEPNGYARIKSEAETAFDPFSSSHHYMLATSPHSYSVNPLQQPRFQQMPSAMPQQFHYPYSASSSSSQQQQFPSYLDQRSSSDFPPLSSSSMPMPPQMTIPAKEGPDNQNSTTTDDSYLQIPSNGLENVGGAAITSSEPTDVIKNETPTFLLSSLSRTSETPYYRQEMVSSVPASLETTFESSLIQNDEVEHAATVPSCGSLLGRTGHDIENSILITD